MNYCTELRRQVAAAVAALAAEGVLPAGLDLAAVTVEPPRDTGHGDVATNAALVLAKPARLAPRVLAEHIRGRLAAAPEVATAEVAGPGFINLRLAPAFWRARLVDALVAGRAYGDSTIGQGEPVNVEYVSANPTGPLHVGHGRGAVFGDVLAALLEKVGYHVTREYYINDAGFQVDALAWSVYWRYRQANGEAMGREAITGFDWRETYPGEYLVPVGAALAARDGRRWLEVAPADWLPAVRQFAIDAMLALIDADLAALGIRHGVFTSERALHADGRIDAALAVLDQKGLIYQGVLEPPKGMKPDDWEPRPQTLFRAANFGDDVDRPLKKSDGSWTYFAADIAYHLDKVERGFRTLIDVWGADHGGYVKRVQAALMALTDGTATLDVKICQLVNLYQRGELVRMSKRAGTFVTLSEVVDEVGKDVFRFYMLTRRNDAPLDFDLAKVLEQSRDNPVFYVQYAHARVASVMRHAREMFPGADLSDAALARADLDRLVAPEEIALKKAIAGWPRVVEVAASAHEPHRIAFYLYDEIAAAFHGLWNRGKETPELRFLVAEDAALSTARLALLRGVATVIGAGLAVMGVEPVEEMR
ncbi:MAG: arginine--tRNA ligase [Alphaproteobacteria bacterium]|nr:arginine--tRNA ligase [Alphaproteobacteria bacterium]